MCQSVIGCQVSKQKDEGEPWSAHQHRRLHVLHYIVQAECCLIFLSLDPALNITCRSCECLLTGAHVRVVLGQQAMSVDEPEGRKSMIGRDLAQLSWRLYSPEPRACFLPRNVVHLRHSLHHTRPVSEGNRFESLRESSHRQVEG